MKKLLIPLALIVSIGAAIGLANLNSSDDASNETVRQTSEQETSAEVQPAENEVFIDNFAFGPEKLVVERGTTVTWTNKDAARHNVDFDDDALEDGPLIGQNETFQYTFNEVGIFDYICTPHPYMTGQVEVI